MGWGLPYQKATLSSVRWGQPHPTECSSMLDAKEKILEAYAGTENLRCELIGSATDQYFVALDAGSSPDEAQLDIAKAAARSLLRKELLSPAWISAVTGI